MGIRLLTIKITSKRREAASTILLLSKFNSDMKMMRFISLTVTHLHTVIAVSIFKVSVFLSSKRELEGLYCAGQSQETIVIWL
jgi:hypothetical protein